MDSITQAALGAAIGEAILGKKIGNKAAYIGAAIATIPDLDVFLSPFFNPLEKLIIHRGYSHSILGCIVMSLIFWWLLKRFTLFKPISNVKVYSFAFIALITHVLLDACTSYGTMLFLPFSKVRVSFDIINVVDPFYTLPLLIGVILSITFFRKKQNRNKWAKIALCVSCFYLLLTVANKAYTTHNFNKAFENKSIIGDDFMSQPVGFGNFNWYAAVNYNDSLYLAKQNMFHSTNIEITSFAINNHLLHNVDDVVRETMYWFSKGHYVVRQVGDTIKFYNLQVDMQGIRETPNYLAPTAWYFQLLPNNEGKFELGSGMDAK